ncbi:MAG: hypothetical protein K6F53_08640 [Lachnospiraceae bacterium]|nr:hypothetical protein [Lachnospiraceae bacterium]
MRKRAVQTILIILCTLLLTISSFAGCGKNGNDVSSAKETASSPEAAAESDVKEGEEEEIELKDPVGTVLRYVTAEVRTIDKADSFQGVVSMQTEIYSYETDQLFGNFGALPGDEVTSGMTLFYGTTDAIDDSIDEIRDQNADLLDDYINYVSDYAIDLSKAKKAEFEAASAYMDMVNNGPTEDSPYYAGFAKGLMPVENNMKKAKEAREKMEESYLQRQESFDLEYAYNEKRISRLEEKQKAAGGIASGDGVVVAANYYLSGDSIPEGSPIMAVGDPAKKQILCEYVGKAVVSKAEDIYALIDGKRYEVEFENMEPEEYRRLKAKNDEVFSTFYIKDEDDSVRLGSLAVIVVVKESNKDLLCIPKDAVNRDDRGAYVFTLQGEESVYTPVSTGVSDSAFIEITHGLSKGDKIVYDAPYDIGDKTEKIKRGSVCVEFDTDGFLFYPSAEWIRNPAKNGTCYLKELCVENYEQVEEGQVLAKVEVIQDNIEIERIKRKIQRQNERIVDLYTKKTETYNEEEKQAIDRSVKDRQRSVESLQKQLSKMTAYMGVIELKAPYTGIVTGITNLKGGELISYREKLIQVTKDESSYIIVDDKSRQLSYGDEVAITVKNGNVDAAGKEIPGQVVSLNATALPKEMQLGYSLIRVPMDVVNEVASGGSGQVNGYWSRNRYGVKAEVKKADNVLLIPKTAVYKTGSETYVMVKNDDGSVKLVKFTAGGGDNANYWVAYGDVTEGMEICWG